MSIDFPPPMPDSGWSSDLLSVEGARIAPPQGKLPLTFPAGVLTADGQNVHQGSVWRAQRRITLPVETPPEPQEHLEGTWLWGGLLYHHFGHFLCESTTRLWALNHTGGPIAGIVFLPKFRASEDGNDPLPGYQRRFFDLMGHTGPVRVQRKPATVERLLVPGQGFGLGPLSSGTAAYREAVHRRFANGIAPEGGKRLYISRSRIGPRKGGLLFETRLEALLEAEGYEVFHPQDHPLEVQIARYRAASHILAAEGSALHFLAFVARADQQVGVIVRRVSGATRNILRNLSAFSGRDPQVISALRRSWMPETIKRKHMAVAELDFPALQSTLRTGGFVTGTTDWPDISEQEARAEIRSERFRRVMNYRPVAD